MEDPRIPHCEAISRTSKVGLLALVKPATENRGVVGSIPTLAIAWQCGLRLSERGAAVVLGN